MSVADAAAAPPRYSEIRFCPRCGAPYRPQDFHSAECLFVCASCDFDFYQNPVPSGVVVVAHPEREDSVLVLKRRTPPGIGLWCLPGGFVGYGEAPAAAAAREAREETGIVVEIDRLLRVGMFDYLYRGRTVCVLEVAFVARVAGALPARGTVTAEAAEVAFLPLDQLPAAPDLLSFPEHARVLRAFRGH